VIEWRAEDTAEALKAVYLGARDRWVRMRLQALWLLRRGWRLEQVAEAVGAEYRSVQRWVAWYRRGGLAEVQAHAMGGVGQPARLTAELQEAIATEVATGRFRTAAEIRDWIAEEYQVDYTVAGVYGLLDRLRGAPKVPRPVHAQADRAAQTAWKKGGSGRRSRRRA
jgi:transposase